MKQPPDTGDPSVVHYIGIQFAQTVDILSPNGV